MPYTEADKFKFIKKLYYEVEDIFEGTGIPTEFVLGVAAQEVGWGEGIIPESNNYFNIQKGPYWTGEVVYKKKAKEYRKEGTVYYEKNAPFRKYDNVVDSIKDFKALLYWKKYKRVHNKDIQGNIEKLAHALFLAGYTTNEEYGDFVKRTGKGPTMKKFLAKLPTEAKLLDMLTEKIKSEIIFDFTLPALRGHRSIEHSELPMILKRYAVCVRHQGDIIGEITKDNLEFDLYFSTSIAYDGNLDAFKMEYQHPRGTKRNAYWSPKTKEFFNPPMRLH